MATDDMVRKYEETLRRKTAIDARVQKIETAREIAAAKIKDQEAKLTSLGVEPAKAEEWLKSEGERISLKLAQNNSEMDEAEKALGNIEASLKALNG